MVGSPSAFTVLSRGWIVSPGMILAGLGIMMVSPLLWWGRENMMSRQRTRLRDLTVLAEEVIPAANPGERSRRRNAVLPGVLEAGERDLYLLDAARGRVERAPLSGT